MKNDLLKQLLEFQCGIYPGTGCSNIVGSLEYQRNSAGDISIKTQDSEFLGEKISVSQDVIFDIASITKQFAAALLIKLWDNEVSTTLIKNT